MTEDLVLKPNCSRCGWWPSSSTTQDLYGSNCKHLTLCRPCGKNMAENGAKCPECGTAVTRLIREYKVRVASNEENNYFLGSFPSGLPNFADPNNEWCSRRQIRGDATSSSLRKKDVNNKNTHKQPWLLEDKTGTQYQGKFDGGQCSKYYFLMMRGTEIAAIPADSCYNFSKVLKYKTLTLEEAEEKMRNRRRTEDGYNRFVMKSARKVEEEFEDKEVGNNNNKDGGEKDAAGRKNRLPLNKKGVNSYDDDNEEGPRIDLEINDINNEDIEKGDDWEHEDIFTDDEEAIDAGDQLEDSAPEIPAPPEIRQDEDDEGDLGLSESGKELKKLLAKANGLNLSEQDEDVKPPMPMSMPEQITSGSSARVTPSPQLPPPNYANVGKRKINAVESESNVTNNTTPLKKFKSENKVITPPPPPAAVAARPYRVTPSSSSSSVAASCPVTEDEIRAFLLSRGKKVTTEEFAAKFKSRLKSKEDKLCVTAILGSMTKIKKNVNGSNVLVLLG